MSGQCAGPSDPDYASLERGLFALGARYVQEIRLFAQDPAAEINGANSRREMQKRRCALCRVTMCSSAVAATTGI